jgi:hypothetical protein
MFFCTRESRSKALDPGLRRGDDRGSGLQGEASRQLSTAGWLVNPLLQWSGNAGDVIEVPVLFRMLSVGGRSRPMLLV